jgi:5S rRNA maturation endonuclease (ribonuclease M5)
MKNLTLRTTTKPYRSYNQLELKIICDQLCDKIDDLLSHFNIDYKHTNSSMISMTCPIHGGDNPTALNIYHEGDNYRGNWKCRTHGCEKFFKESILGFIRGIISNRKYKWGESGDKTASFYEAINFAEKFLGNSIAEIKIDYQTEDKKSFTRIIEKIHNNSNTDTVPSLTRDVVRSHLKIPSQYYINRGYSSDVLVKYDVGLCDRPNKEMSNRVVAPVYDITGQYVVGCTGRSIFEKCGECKYHHDHNHSCPSKEEGYKYSKWKHSNGFKCQNHLYNLWFSKEYIKKDHIVIIVESPGNVWRLEENDIHNSVAIFGSSMSDRQKLLLDSSGAMKIVILTDNDDAGKKAAENIIEKCQKTYQIYTPTISKSDIGEMTSDEINKQIKEYLKSIT